MTCVEVVSFARNLMPPSFRVHLLAQEKQSLVEFQFNVWETVEEAMLAEDATFRASRYLL